MSQSHRAPVPDGLPATTALELERLTRAHYGAAGVAGIAAGVVVDQDLVWELGVGYADFETSRRPDAATLFQIASISKTFTATAVLQLRDAGALGLDDPLVRHVPEFARASNPFGPVELVTLRNLLLHSSGLQMEVPNNDPREQTELTQPELIDALDRVRVVIAPGAAFKYSNLGYRLLAEVVSRTSGQPFSEYRRDATLDPLEMRCTAPEPQGELATRRARGYQPRQFDDRLAPARTFDHRRCVGAGDLWSSVEDLARWLAQQFRSHPGAVRGPNQVLAGSSLDEMHRPTVVVDPALERAWGLGWGMIRRDGRVLVGHTGLVPGHTSLVYFCPRVRVGVITLANGVGTRHLDALASALIATVIARAPMAERGVTPAAPPPAPPVVWRELVGIYRLIEENVELRVEATTDGLIARQTYGSTELLPTDDPLRFRIFEGQGAGEELRFLRGPGGGIDALNAAGYVYLRWGPVTSGDLKDR